MASLSRSQNGQHKGERTRSRGLQFHRVRRPAGKIAMGDHGRVAVFAQGLRHSVRGIDRSVPTAGAAEGDMDVAFALRAIAGEKVQQEIADAREVLLEPVGPPQVLRLGR